MAYKRTDVLPAWERAWRKWVAKGIEVDIGLNYLADHPPDPDYWHHTVEAETLGTGSLKDPATAGPRWRVAAFRYAQVLLTIEDGTPCRKDMIVIVRHAVVDSGGMIAPG